MGGERILGRRRCVDALLTDTLPYEVPLWFSNAAFHALACRVGVRLLHGGTFRLGWSSGIAPSDLVSLGIIGGVDAAAFARPELTSEMAFPQGCSKIGYTLPLDFELQKANGFRVLSLIHPAAQLVVCNFYDRHEHLLTHLLEGGSSSLRRAVASRSRRGNTRSKAHPVPVEERGTYFPCRPYSRVHQFHEGRLYRNLTREYENLLRLDVHACFASIYTHTIEWAILGKEHTKRNLKILGPSFTADSSSFGAEFDKLMQFSNYNETNGIPVGSEASRIFAEFVLQAVDRGFRSAIEAADALQGRVLLKRYVDDFYLFIDQAADVDLVRGVLSQSLAKYKLRLSEQKEQLTTESLADAAALAKDEQKKIVDKFLAEHDALCTTSRKDRGKAIRKAVGAATAGVFAEMKRRDEERPGSASYAISRLYHQLKDQVNADEAAENAQTDADWLERGRNCLDFCFDLYLLSPHVSSMNWVLSIAELIIRRLRGQAPQNEEAKSLELREFETFVWDWLVLCARRADRPGRDSGEHAAILSALPFLDPRSNFRRRHLNELFGVEPVESGSRNLRFKVECTYSRMISLLGCVGREREYVPVRKLVVDAVIGKFQKAGGYRPESTEHVLLLTDLTACPYLTRRKKRRLLKETIQLPETLVGEYLNGPPMSFVRWDFDGLLDVLRLRRAKKVY